MKIKIIKTSFILFFILFIIIFVFFSSHSKSNNSISNTSNASSKVILSEASSMINQSSSHSNGKSLTSQSSTMASSNKKTSASKTQAKYSGPYSDVNGAYGGIDGLGRVLANDDNGSLVRKDRYVGIFYFTWLGQHGTSGPYDNNKIFTSDPSSAFDESKWGPVQVFHFWAEPLFGYYTTDDEWVLRKHIKMLTDANVDFLILDATNAFTYDSQALKLMKLLVEYQQKGWNVPKIAFYTNSSSGQTMNKIYQNIYLLHPAYKSVWFNWEGKPLIIGDKNDDVVMAEVKSFFRIKSNQWPNEPVKADGFPWISFDRQPHVFKNAKGENEVIVVSPAQHPQINFASTAFYGHTNLNWPRTYHNGKNDLSAGAMNYGYNFAEMFEYAIKQDPKMIFITGWNEWVAQRQSPPNKEEPIFFVDCADPNCSRDIEPMKGGFEDNYYMQMINYIRKYKGVAPRVNVGDYKTIDTNGSFSQWNSVTAVYKNFTDDIGDRSAKGFGSLYYANSTGRNDFSLIKVARDKTNIYFYVKTVNHITSSKDFRWMNLFINTNMKNSLNWNGYNFVLNRVSPSDNKIVLEKCMGGWTWGAVGEVSYKVIGNEMQICIPQELLHINTTVSPINIQFKWADNYQGEDDIFSFYIDGDVAPYGRLNYVFAE